MKCLKNKILSLIVTATYFGLSITIYAQGTLSETATTMELQGKLENVEAQQVGANPATEENKTDQQQTIARFDKVAQKLLRSLHTGKFDREDFSAKWTAIIPAGKDFSEGINTLIRPVLTQFGRAEKLLEGKIVGPDKAMFPVQFSGGTLDMTFSLDAQDKIDEWVLMPRTAPVASPASPAMGEQPAMPDRMQVESPAPPQDTNVPDIKDFNSFQREINRMNIETRSEERMWLGRLEQKPQLAKAIEDLVTAELMFIRKLAETENADQTVKAVNLVLKQRQERLAKLEEKLKEERQQQMIERRESRTRGERPERPERPERERTRERPARRARETTTEQQQD